MGIYQGSISRTHQDVFLKHRLTIFNHIPGPSFSCELDIWEYIPAAPAEQVLLQEAVPSDTRIIPVEQEEEEEEEEEEEDYDSDIN